MLQRDKSILFFGVFYPLTSCFHFHECVSFSVCAKYSIHIPIALKFQVQCKVCVFCTCSSVSVSQILWIHLFLHLVCYFIGKSTVDAWAQICVFFVIIGILNRHIWMHLQNIRPICKDGNFKRTQNDCLQAKYRFISIRSVI